MNWLRWFGFLGIILIVISLAFDAINRTYSKVRKKRIVGSLQLSALIFGVIGFFLIGTHFIENMILTDGLLIGMIILYSLSFLTRFLMRNQKDPQV